LCALAFFVHVLCLHAAVIPVIISWFSIIAKVVDVRPQDFDFAAYVATGNAHRLIVTINLDWKLHIDSKGCIA
jgi:hypothetical protein